MKRILVIAAALLAAHANAQEDICAGNPVCVGAAIAGAILDHNNGFIAERNEVRVSATVEVGEGSFAIGRTLAANAMRVRNAQITIAPAANGGTSLVYRRDILNLSTHSKLRTIAIFELFDAAGNRIARAAERKLYTDHSTSSVDRNRYGQTFTTSFDVNPGRVSHVRLTVKTYSRGD